MESKVHTFVFSSLFFVSFFALSHSQSLCVSNPFTQNCTSYVIPSSQINGYIQSMCDMMSYMPGCSINNLCSSQSSLQSDRFCLPFSVYEDLCEDMPMKSCNDYFSMCQNGTVVTQCYTAPLSLPRSDDVLTLITDMCNDMFMPECEKCVSESKDATMGMNCDILTVYSNLCLSMPHMGQCQPWKTMCAEIPNWPLCSNKGSNHPVPQMRMYFHLGITDYILFQHWVPRTKLAYAGTFLLVVVAQVFHDFLKYLRKKAENKWKNSFPLQRLSLNESDSAGAPPFNFVVDVSRAIMQSIEVALGFMIMLVAMTFNVGLFFAIILGSFLGTLIFGRFLYGGDYQPPTGSCH